MSEYGNTETNEKEETQNRKRQRNEKESEIIGGNYTGDNNNDSSITIINVHRIIYSTGTSVAGAGAAECPPPSAAPAI